MELWVATYGGYDDAQVVGVAPSEEAAKDLVRAAYRADMEGCEEVMGEVGPLKGWVPGTVDGPFKLGELFTRD